MKRPAERNERRRERAKAARTEAIAMLRAANAFHESVNVVPDKRNGYKLVATMLDLAGRTTFTLPDRIDGISVETKRRPMTRWTS